MALVCVSTEDLYAKEEQLKREDVQKLLEWQHMQPHMPRMNELEAIIFLYSCYFSNEKSKHYIDNYLTCRTHCPEFFAKRDPMSHEVQAALNTCGIAIMPNRTPEGYAVFYSGLINVDPDVYNFNNALKIVDMYGSIFQRQFGCVFGQIIIIDLKGATLTHVLKSGVLSVKKFLFYLQNALPTRIISFHFVNAVPFMDKVLALVKPFMSKDLQERLFVHYGNNESIYKMVPQDCLPGECGGYGGALKDLHVATRRIIEANKEFYLKEEKYVIDESQRPGKPKNAGELFGVEGTFKKLDID